MKGGISSLVAALALAGCTVGPDYKAPEMAVPDRYHSAPQNQGARPEADLSQW
jgi:hypothetical protein